MESEQFITDDYWQLINYNYDQIKHAELKASIIVSIYSIFLTIDDFSGLFFGNLFGHGTTKWIRVKNLCFWVIAP